MAWRGLARSGLGGSILRWPGRLTDCSRARGDVFCYSSTDHATSMMISKIARWRLPDELVTLENIPRHLNCIVTHVAVLAVM